MTGIKLGDRVLILGVSDTALIAALGIKAGLTGRTCIVDTGEREVAHAAVLCPSFYRASIINNPSRLDRFKAQVRGALIGFLQRRLARRQFAAA